MAPSTKTTKLLQKQLKELNAVNSIEVYGFSAALVNEDDILKWKLVILGPAGSLYKGGVFNAIMKFPENYPVSPPTVKFESEIWHPNIYRDGDVCISILHPSGADPYGYELASERWRSVYTVESIVLSVISLLYSPNAESPANVDAAIQWRNNMNQFKKEVRRCVDKSLRALRS